MTLPKTPGLPAGSRSAGLGALFFGALFAGLPVVGDGYSSAGQLILSYALVAAAVGVVLYGLLELLDALRTPVLLLCGAVATAFGVGAAFGGRPEAFDGPYPALPLILLFSSDLLRILAAAALGLALARYLATPGTALLIAGVATLSDLFSVFAGPTKGLVSADSPALDYLLLIFPTFGNPLGFALGISDFIFLALFATASRWLDLRHPLTLLAGVLSVVLAMTSSLALGLPLPALPFIALSFVAVNTDLIYRHLRSGP